MLHDASKELVEISKEKSPAVGEAYTAIFQPTPGIRVLQALLSHSTVTEPLDFSHVSESLTLIGRIEHSAWPSC